jgi:limonene-1,2-epoxide hydrolase
MDRSPEAIVRGFFTSWAEMDPDVHASFFAADGVYVDGTLRYLEGRDAIREAATIFPKHRVDVRKLLAADGVVMVERVDNFELEGQWFHLDVAGVCELDDDGNITRWRDYYDLKSISDQVAAAGIATSA